MSRRNFSPGTLLAPVPVVMVTCGSAEEGTANIITVAWTGIVNSNPPMTYVSIRRERFSHHLISESGEFCINLVTEQLVRATDWCGVQSGKDHDKFAETGLTMEECSRVSCPSIKESPLCLECRVQEVHSYGSHDMFVAEIVNMSTDEALVDGSGRIRLDRVGLVSYCHGEYFPLKKMPLGRFGFSVMKKKTKKKLAARRRGAARKRAREKHRK
ncbi:MAG: flavin reductase family protein [Anaerovoracaceae bacterium]|jgi:flavin reductase (DIM6/NTAB) family NADH-FMN oxidoreductase RutF